MSTAVAERPRPGGAVETALVQGDLSGLSEPQRVEHYLRVCESVGLNPVTKPFEYLLLKGEGGKDKLVLYATRACTDQLRSLHEVSLTIVDRKESRGVYVVTARATMPGGRTDESTGAVPLEKENGEWKTAQSGKRYFAGNGTASPLVGEALANALMKAETKAKRRVTLSICGLGYLDESEIDSIPDARPVAASGPAHEPQAQATHAPANGANGHAPAAPTPPPVEAKSAEPKPPPTLLDGIAAAEAHLVKHRLAATGELLADLKRRFPAGVETLARETVRTAIEDFKERKKRERLLDEIDELAGQKGPGSWQKCKEALGIQGDPSLEELTPEQALKCHEWLAKLPSPEPEDAEDIPW